MTTFRLSVPAFVLALMAIAMPGQEADVTVLPYALTATLPEGDEAELAILIGNAPEAAVASYEVVVRTVDPAPSRTSVLFEAGDFSPPDWSAPHEPGRLLVVYDLGREPNAASRDAMHRTMNARLVHRFSLVEADSVETTPNVDLETLARRYAAQPGVIYVQPDFLYEPDVIPDDFWYKVQLNMDTIDMPRAWDITQGNHDVVVAVIDTGVDYNHIDLAANIWVNEDEIPDNGIDDDGNGYVDDIHGYDFYDEDSDPIAETAHATHVSGIIGAVGNDGYGVAGVNWNVQIMICRFLNPNGSTTDALRALEYAVANGARASNNSWGGSQRDSLLEMGIAAAGEAGHLFIAAAGNNAEDNAVHPHYPAAYDLPNIISVAATRRGFDTLASFSNFGATTVHLAAPGDTVLSTFPGGTHTFLSGTSMAAPHVTGVAAMLLGLNPSATVEQIKSWILDSVDKLDELEGFVITDGRLNATSALAHAEPLWINVDGQRRGTLDPGESVQLDFNVSALGLLPGQHHAWVDVHTNDPDQTVFTLPATLNVTSNPTPPAANALAVEVLNDRRSAIALPASDLNVGDTLTHTVLSLPASGTLYDPMGHLIIAVPHDLPTSNPTVVYRPEPGSQVVAQFYHSVSDGVFESASAEIQVSVVDPDDHFTELFASASPFDLSNLAITFTPNGTGGYTARTRSITALPTDPTGGQVLALTDDGHERLDLTDDISLPLFGEAHSDLFVSANGFLFTDSEKTAGYHSLQDHFDDVRISALNTDLNPEAMGTVSYRALPDRLAVTWEGVPVFAKAAVNTFQIEIRNDGRFTLAYLDCAATYALVGLSNGSGVSEPFRSSNLSGYRNSSPTDLIDHLLGLVTLTAEEQFDNDANEDGALNAADLAEMLW